MRATPPGDLDGMTHMQKLLLITRKDMKKAVLVMESARRSILYFCIYHLRKKYLHLFKLDQFSDLTLRRGTCRYVILIRSVFLEVSSFCRSCDKITLGTMKMYNEPG